MNPVAWDKKNRVAYVWVSVSNWGHSGRVTKTYGGHWRRVHKRHWRTIERARRLATVIVGPYVGHIGPYPPPIPEGARRTLDATKIKIIGDDGRVLWEGPLAFYIEDQRRQAQARMRKKGWRNV